MIIHSKDLHKMINFVTLDDVEKLVLDEADACGNLEVYGVEEIKIGNKRGLRFDFFDYLDKVTDFECDVEDILYELDKQLPEKFVFKHYYSDLYSVSGLDGLEYPDYHCWLKIWEVEK